MSKQKIYDMSFSKIFPLYVAKIERKGRNVLELYSVIEWLTGYTKELLEEAIRKEVSLKEFFAAAPNLNDKRSLIKGVICGVRVEEIKEDLMREIRYLDKVVDELAKGKKLSVILRQ